MGEKLHIVRLDIKGDCSLNDLLQLKEEILSFGHDVKTSIKGKHLQVSIGINPDISRRGEDETK